MRLSKLQKRIISEIANHTINFYECSKLCDADLINWHKHKWGELYVSYNDLYSACYNFWGEGPDFEWYLQNPDGRDPTGNKRKAAFSRSLHCLVEKKGFVNAMALGWHSIGWERGQYYDNLHCWQGGGRKRKVGEFTVGGRTFDSTSAKPVYKLLGLTDTGWPIARELLGPEIGWCEHIRRYRTSKQ